MATKKTKTAVDPIREAVQQIQAAPLSEYDAGEAVDPGTKVFRQSDIDRLQAEIDAMQSILDFALVRGDATLNNQSAKGFNTLDTTGYWRYTGTAIDNPIPNGYGIIINLRYTAYAVQLLFSRTKSTAPTKLLYRMGINMTDTPSWSEWMEVTANALSS